MADQPSSSEVLEFCRVANDVATAAVAAGNHPFGAVLVSENGMLRAVGLSTAKVARTALNTQWDVGTGEVLMRQGNVDTVNHAESTLARQAYKDYTFEQLQKCTLYSTFEPCAVRDINITLCV